MSKVWTQETCFKCSNDCRQSGCPGHKFGLKINNISDSVSILLDENEIYSFPQDIFEEAIKHWNKYLED